MSRLLATAAVAISLAVSAAELRGPLPILSVPYHDDGALDVETLVKEARFVADAGVGGFIWCQSNDAIDLLTREEKMDSVWTGPCGSEGLVGISSLSWRMLKWRSFKWRSG